MSYPINYPTPQGANIQIFRGGDPQQTGQLFEKTWVKPQGASFVWFTLIGSGGTSDGTTGGGSAAVTNFMCPAFLIPDSLSVVVAGLEAGVGAASEILYQQKTGTGYSLLTAAGGASGSSGGAGGAAMTANYFTAMGFFQSVAGQAGFSGANPPSDTTFLSGGSATGSVTANYGYSTSASGFSQVQPIIVGVAGGVGASSFKSGVGCGGGGSNGNRGGEGLVVIVTW